MLLRNIQDFETTWDAQVDRALTDNACQLWRQKEQLKQQVAREFPGYRMFSQPVPLTVNEVPSLLRSDEALVSFVLVKDLTERETLETFALTRAALKWTTTEIKAAAVSDKVATFRRGLDVDVLYDPLKKQALFDKTNAYALYELLFGQIDALIRDKRHLLVVPMGPLTALPFLLLVTEPPRATNVNTLDAYRDAARLIKRHAVTVLPSVTSLKVLRDVARKPMIGFGDPVFNPNAPEGAAETRSQEARLLMTRAYTDFWQGAAVDRKKLSGSRSCPKPRASSGRLRAILARSQRTSTLEKMPAKHVKHAPLLNTASLLRHIWLPAT
jgi:hypothetical protein